MWKGAKINLFGKATSSKSENQYLFGGAMRMKKVSDKETENN